MLNRLTDIVHFIRFFFCVPQKNLIKIINDVIVCFQLSFINDMALLVVHINRKYIKLLYTQQWHWSIYDCVQFGWRSKVVSTQYDLRNVCKKVNNLTEIFGDVLSRSRENQANQMFAIFDACFNNIDGFKQDQLISYWFKIVYEYKTTKCTN